MPLGLGIVFVAVLTPATYGSGKRRSPWRSPSASFNATILAVALAAQAGCRRIAGQG